MGELIIHIDQSTGAVLKVVQTLKYKDKKALLEKKILKENLDENKRHVKILRTLEKKNPEAAKKLKREYTKIDKWLRSKKQSIEVELTPLGDIYNDDPKVVEAIKDHRDDFDRIVSVPVEFWEKIDKSVCSVKIGGVLRKCHH